jgi:hypothetical protein
VVHFANTRNLPHRNSGRSQIEFRTIQELTQPDPDNRREVFVTDQWEPSVAYNTLNVCSRIDKGDMVTNSPASVHNTEYSTEEDLARSLAEERARLDDSAVWAVVADALKGSAGVRDVDKIVFFYSSGMSDGCDYCQRAIFLLAVATRMRDLILVRRREEMGDEGGQRKKGKRGSSSGVIPIYMPAFDVSRIWNADEYHFLLGAGVIPIESNGELFLKVDANAAVISYRHWNPVKQVVADIARPAVMICKPVWSPKKDFETKQEQRNGVPFVLP